VNVFVDGTPTNVNDTTAPSVPADVVAQSLGDKQVALSWTPSTDAGVGHVGYLVKRGTKIIARVWTPGYVDRPANVGTYSYTIVAFDGYGNNVAAEKVDGVSAW
jgi:hypothetical protein